MRLALLVGAVLAAGLLAQRACAREPAVRWGTDEWPSFTVHVGHPAFALRDSIQAFALPGRVYLRDSIAPAGVIAHEAAHQRQYGLYGVWPTLRKIVADAPLLYTRGMEPGMFEFDARIDAGILTRDGVFPPVLPAGIRHVELRACRRPEAFYQQCAWLDGALQLTPAVVRAAPRARR